MHGYQANLELERREVQDWAGISRPQVYYSLEKLARPGTGSRRRKATSPRRGQSAACMRRPPKAAPRWRTLWNEPSGLHSASGHRS